MSMLFAPPNLIMAFGHPRIELPKAQGLIRSIVPEESKRDEKPVCLITQESCYQCIQQGPPDPSLSKGCIHGKGLDMYPAIFDFNVPDAADDPTLVASYQKRCLFDVLDRELAPDY
jgi:hypothetical protein